VKSEFSAKAVQCAFLECGPTICGRKSSNQGVRRKFVNKVLIYLFILALPCVKAEPGSVTGEWEGQLMSSRRPIVLYINFDNKSARLDAAGSKLWPLEIQNTQGTGIQFQISVRDQKLEFSGIRIAGQITGTITGERTTFFSLNRLPDATVARDRIEAWRQDLDVVVNRFLKYDRSYSDQQRKEAIRILQDLEANLKNLKDQEIIVGISRAVAQTDNAHTRLYLLRNRTELRRYPIRLWWFSDGLHVVKATPEHQELLGCKVTQIGKSDPLMIRGKVSELFAGNESWINYKSVYYLTSPEVLHGLHVIKNMEKSEWTFLCQRQIIKKTIAPLPLERKDEPTEAWWDLTPEWKEEDGAWIHSLSRIRKQLPLYLRKPAEHYWFETIPSRQAIFFQYNRSQNKQDAETLHKFGERLLNALDNPELKTLVVDLRFNTGGDLGIARDLMESLKKKVAGKGLRANVLIARSTFSAGISHAVQWKESGSVTFAGETCGDELDTFSEGGNLVLPNSKLTVHYANGFHGYSKVEYPQYQPYYLDMNVDNLNPDIRAQLSSADYFSGKDPVLDAIFAKE
jgi:hypothetical protein